MRMMHRNLVSFATETNTPFMKTLAILLDTASATSKGSLAKECLAKFELKREQKSKENRWVENKSHEDH